MTVDLRDKVNCCFYSVNPAAKAALLQEIDNLPDVVCPDPDGEQEFSCADCDLADKCKCYLKARLELPERSSKVITAFFFLFPNGAKDLLEVF